MNKTLRTKSSNNRIVSFMVILGLFVFSMSGCQQGGGEAPKANANSEAPKANANSEAPKANTNAEVPNANTDRGNSDTGVMAPPKPDNCPGPGDNEVIVFERIFSDNGGGKCVVLKPGEYKNAAEIGLANDSMSSIKIGVNVRATVCENDDFGTPCEEFEKTDLDLMDNPTIKNDTASSIKVVEVKPESKPEAIKAFNNTLVGEWVAGSYKYVFTEDKLESIRLSDNQVNNSQPYKVVDGKTVEFRDGKAIITFEDNGNTLIWFRPETGATFKFKRVQPK